jgi:hypothetical protein
VPALTVSFGISDSQSADTIDEIVSNADRALLNATAMGRNRVVLADLTEFPAGGAPVRPFLSAATETR